MSRAGAMVPPRLQGALRSELGEHAALVAWDPGKGWNKGFTNPWAADPGVRPEPQDQQAGTAEMSTNPGWQTRCIKIPELRWELPEVSAGRGSGARE